MNPKSRRYPTSDKAWSRSIDELLASSSEERIPVSAFEQIFPWLADQIRQDSAGRLSEAWGLSTLYDEIANERIVPRSIVDVVSRVAGGGIRNRHLCHAGFAHTYLYLLSDMDTRFGKKRHRWTEGTLERGLNLPAGFLSPAPERGTLLANVTCILRWLIADRVRNQGLMIDGKEHIGAINEFVEIKERFEIERRDTSTSVSTTTRMIPFVARQPNAWGVLVYCAGTGRSAQKLVTCFPITAEAKQEFASQPQGRSVACRLRFNARISGIPERRQRREHLGVRRIRESEG